VNLNLIGRYILLRGVYRFVFLRLDNEEKFYYFMEALPKLNVFSMG